MTDVHEAVWRDGMAFTRQHLQRIDRANEITGGLIIPVQGGFSDAPLSGTTHRLLGCADYRRWHVNDSTAGWITRVLRDLCGTGHERKKWQGFPEEHFHDATLGDDIPGVMDALAIEQINGPNGYRNGGDGVAGTDGDWQTYRPNPIKNYVYLEDDMTPEEHNTLMEIKSTLIQFKDAEWSRDQKEKELDKKRFTEVITLLGKQVDMMKIALPKISDTATKTQVKNRMNEIMTYLRNNPDVKGVDNPDDSQMP